jgi:predicted Rossmann fold nucleotide-binding protein DprA/Smf involved in DNA uptake
MTRTVTITGTRAVEGDVAELFKSYLGPFADRDAHFYLGGAAGIDTAAMDWLAGMTPSALTVVVPCAVEDQPANAANAIRHWERAGRLAALVELGAPERGTEAFHARNRWMVDHSGFVIGFPRRDDPASGTWHTLNYATDQGKPRLIVPV